MDHAVIMAGGGGTRLWPMSRRARPKQLLPLLDDRSLLAVAVERLAGIFAPQCTWIITAADLVDAVRQAAPAVPAANVLGEPAIRDTANAIGVAGALLRRRDADARIGIFTADHIIRPQDRFAGAVGDAFGLLDDRPEALVTLGVLPSHPHTGLGYIHRGESVGGRAYHVRGFKEKPDRATAARYLAEGDYYWNSGMFVWRADAVAGHLARFRPDHAEAIERTADAWADGDAPRVAELYGELPKISIDYALMEPAAGDADVEVLVRELDCQWMDLGAWSVLGEVSETDTSDNLRRGRVITLDAAGNVLVNDGDDGHLLAVIGAEDLVVVRSGDATLVAPKARAQDLKALLASIRERWGDTYD